MSYDHWKTTDTVGERQAEEDLAAEFAEEQAWRELLSSGLAGDVITAYDSEDQGEIFALISAYRYGSDDDMLQAARLLGKKLMDVAEDFL